VSSTQRSSPGAGSARHAHRTGTRGVPRAVREPLILDVAGQVFAEVGYERASMDRIAQRAGISKPMLYAYFESKEGLYVSYLERTGRELVMRLVAADRSDAPATVRLRGLTAEFLGFVSEHRDGWAVLFHEFNANRPVVDLVAKLRAQVIGEITSMLELRSPSWRGVPSPASEGVAHAIVGAGESLANWWLEHSDVAREDVTDWLVGLAQAAIMTAATEDARGRRPATPRANPRAGSRAARPA
jgi:AcrR family transcriptional regulator